jgi:hypothetical protein
VNQASKAPNILSHFISSSIPKSRCPSNHHPLLLCQQKCQPSNWGLRTIREYFFTTLSSRHTLLLLFPELGRSKFLRLFGRDYLVAHSIEFLDISLVDDRDDWFWSLERTSSSSSASPFSLGPAPCPCTQLCPLGVILPSLSSISTYNTDYQGKESYTTAQTSSVKSLVNSAEWVMMITPPSKDLIALDKAPRESRSR